MKKTQNPFTHMYGTAGQAYINMGWAEKAIENFSYDKPSEYVYKIIGARGSGKTVVLSDILGYFRNKELAKDGFLVYDLSSARDPLHTLVAYLTEEDFSGKKKLSGLHLSASVGVVNAGLSLDSSESEKYRDDEVELDKLLAKAFDKGKKILVCIDDIVKTEAMTAFCSVYAKYIRVGAPFYFICTGLYSNINALGRVRSLTFFRRAESIEVRALSEVSVTMKYKKFFGIETEEARKLAMLTKGYAYAYQVLGSLYFNKKETESLEDLIDDFDEILFSQSYEKIWEELTGGEKTLLKIMLEYRKREEILKQMKKPGNYSEYRSSLIRGGLIRETARGEIDFCLPRFEEYIRYFCLDLD